MIHSIFKREQTPAPPERTQINNLSQKTQRVLFRARAVFPFDFFPDELLIDENQVRLVIRRFFLAEQIETILIKDIQWVTVETAPFFGTLTICTFKFGSSPIVIKYLPLSKATKARQLLQGLITTNNEGIDVSKLDKKELVGKLEIIGAVKEK